jgi:YesN/AraC family two-component response regulator
MIMVSVIIADDESDIQDSLTVLLEERGIKVIGKANDGEAASQLYLRLKPDVIILDLKMPNYDGHYAIEKIKQEDPLAKIIVVSAYLDKSFPASSVSAVLSKPYDIEELTKKITEIAK